MFRILILSFKIYIQKRKTEVYLMITNEILSFSKKYFLHCTSHVLQQLAACVYVLRNKIFLHSMFANKKIGTFVGSYITDHIAYPPFAKGKYQYNHLFQDGLKVHILKYVLGWIYSHILIDTGMKNAPVLRLLLRTFL